jgi:hypothetical protein
MVHFTEQYRGVCTMNDPAALEIIDRELLNELALIAALHAEAEAADLHLDT